jgi:hypothetical protein
MDAAFAHIWNFKDGKIVKIHLERGYEKSMGRD